MTELSKGLKALAEQIRERHRRGELPAHDIHESRWQACKPTCEICHGNGWFMYDVPRGHAQYGRTHPCPNRTVDKTVSGLKDYEINKMSWDDIVPDGNIMEVVTAVKDSLSLGYGMVYIWGKPGRGKTMVLQRAVKTAIEVYKVNALYTQTNQILDYLRESYDEEKKSHTMNRRIQNLIELIDVLCIDEFEKFNATGWADERIQMIMNERYRRSIHQLGVTIMASNAPPSSLESAYLRDRIEDGRHRVIHVTGDSLRPASFLGD